MDAVLDVSIQFSQTSSFWSPAFAAVILVLSRKSIQWSLINKNFTDYDLRIYLLVTKDMNKEKYFVLDLMTFIFHGSTANHAS